MEIRHFKETPKSYVNIHLTEQKFTPNSYCVLKVQNHKSFYVKLMLFKG